MLPGMAAKPTIAIVGAGNLGTALTVSLRRAGYTIEAVIARSNSGSLNKARRLAREVKAQAMAGVPSRLRAEVIWFCVPDAKIESVAKSWAKFEWRGRIALHSSGALTSDELAPLRLQGAAAASVHPFMTFVRGSQPSLTGVPFAVEGDAAATRVARRIVTDLGGHAFSIRKTDKAAYHAWGTFASPFLVALLVTAEQVAAMAGISKSATRRRMTPILQQTVANYAKFGARGAFSGPIIRGDVDTVRRHLRVLRRNQGALDVYFAMARSAVRNLPARNQHALMKALAQKRPA
jgi:predicted short-subunit dehydrogenase-like oxidoreductase (DUF2520 family)